MTEIKKYFDKSISILNQYGHSIVLTEFKEGLTLQEGSNKICNAGGSREDQYINLLQTLITSTLQSIKNNP